MKHIKVRKIENSIGGIFPKEWGLHEGDVLNVRREGNLFILDAQDSAKEQDRQLFEESFADFETKKNRLENRNRRAFWQIRLEEIDGKIYPHLLRVF